MNNELMNQTIGAIINIIQILIPLAGAFYAFYKAGFGKFVESKISLIGDSALRDKVQQAFDRVDKLLTDGIITAESTAKQEVLEKIKKGELTKESLKQIGIDVALAVRNQLSNKVVDLLKEEIVDVEDYINNRLERLLTELKIDPNAPVYKTEVSQSPAIEKPIVESKEEVVESSSEPIPVAEESGDEIPER